MALTPMYLKNDSLQRSQVQTAEFYYFITNTVTIVPIAQIINPILTGFADTDLTQTIVEAYLGHASTADCNTIFDSTALAADAMGFVIDMKGQCDTIYGFEYTGYQTVGGTPEKDTFLVQATQGALDDTAVSAVAAYGGDIYGRVVQTNLGSTTTGFIKLKILYRSK